MKHKTCLWTKLSDDQGTFGKYETECDGGDTTWGGNTCWCGKQIKIAEGFEKEMVRFELYNWAFSKSIEDKLIDLGYDFKHPSIIVEGEDVYAALKKIHQAGIEVMLIDGKHLPILYVDDGRFRQR